MCCLKVNGCVSATIWIQRSCIPYTLTNSWTRHRRVSGQSVSLRFDVHCNILSSSYFTISFTLVEKSWPGRNWRFFKNDFFLRKGESKTGVFWASLGKQRCSFNVMQLVCKNTDSPILRMLTSKITNIHIKWKGFIPIMLNTTCFRDEHIVVGD